jgi:hypothetical protein
MRAHLAAMVKALKNEKVPVFDAQAFSIRPVWREKLWNIEDHS